MSKPIPPTLKAVNKATRELRTCTRALRELEFSNNTAAIRRARENVKWATDQELAAVNRHFDATGEWA